MGQKTHPKGFRLVTTQKHLSEWYSRKVFYPSFIQEDFFIRSKVEEVFKKFLSISRVEISRLTSEADGERSATITLYALHPRAKDMYKKVAEYFIENENLNPKQIALLNNLKGFLKKFTALLLKRIGRNLIRFLQMKTGKLYSINFRFIRNPFEDAVLIAKFIAEQLEKRIPFKRAVKKAIKKVQIISKKGIKIQVSGRLNGIDIARSEWKKYGKVPLHTLKAKIDYTHQTAETVYGTIGIKVWLYNGE